MGDELFLRSRCSGGVDCHCSGMEHFYVPDSTDRAPQTSSRRRRTSSQAGGAFSDSSMHSAKSTVRPTLARTGGATQSCTATLLASVFDQVSGGAPADGRQVRSRRDTRSECTDTVGQGTEPAGDTSRLADLSYLAYSSDDEYEDFMKKPRTDYTYSRSLSYTAVSPDTVGPPSMSRLGLHAAGDSPVLGSRTAAGGARIEERTQQGGLSRRTAGGRQQMITSPALAGGGEQSVYESSSTRVYSYRQEITSHVSSASLLSNASVAPPRSFAYSSSSAAGAPSMPPSPLSAGQPPGKGFSAGQPLGRGFSAGQPPGRGLSAYLPPGRGLSAGQPPGRGYGAAAGSSALPPSSPAGSQNSAVSSWNSAVSSWNSAESSRPTPSSEDTLLDLDFTGAMHGISAGLDADSQDEEWLPTDDVSKLATNRCSTPYKTHSDWSVRRGARLVLISPLLRLWLLLTAVCRHLWTAARPLFIAPITGKPPRPSPLAEHSSAGLATARPPATAGGAAAATARDLAAAAGVGVATAGRAGEERRGSRPPSRSQHRYHLRPRLTPQRDCILADRPAGATAAATGGPIDGLNDRQTDGWTDSGGGGGDSHSSRRPVSSAASAAAPGSSEAGRLVTALAWLAAVVWFVNPLRWAAAAGRAAVSRVRTAAEVLDLPRGAATVATALNPAAWVRALQRKLSGSSGREGRPGWLRSAGALLWGSVGTAATSAPTTTAQPGSVPPGSGTRMELWRRSRSSLDGAGSGEGAGSRAGASNGGSRAGGQWSAPPASVGAAAESAVSRAGRRRCLSLAAAALLLTLLTLLLLLLLPIMGWVGRDDAAVSSKHTTLLPVEWWPLLDSAGQHVAAGLSSVAAGLSSLGVYALAAVQAAVTQLCGVAGSVAAVIWVPPSPGPVTPATPASVIDAISEPAPAPAAPAPAPASASASASASPSDPRLSVVVAQLDELKSRVDLLQSEYQSCLVASERSRSAAASCLVTSERSRSAAAVRAALGLPLDSPSPVTADRLAASELRLQQRLQVELAAVGALLSQQSATSDGSSEGGLTGVAALTARLAALESTLPAAEQQQRRRRDAADARLDSLAAEMERLRADIAHLHLSLAAARAGLEQTGACCNHTSGPDWSSLLGAQIGQLQKQMEDRMLVYTATIRKDLTSQASSLTGTGGSRGGISRREALDIAQRELALYDADKTGKFDFALESAGGSIVSTKCTEAYTVRSARLTVLGVPVWYPANNPRSIIQPHMQPGECFAFHGEGQFVVALSRPVKPSEFVIEHIARGLTPGGRIDSAPRHCSVLSVGDDGEETVLLASFEYSASGPPLQRFPASQISSRTVSAVELRVSSNWGHPEYTCMYRFRVHGEPEEGEKEVGDAEGGNR